ncbi:MAG: acetyl-CoA decarbonylase/synthase complex subunit gamma [Candidatus Hodarchaeota archaeon]
MVKRVSPIDIYKYVPKNIDFKKYGIDSGMAFVTELLERKVKIEDIPEMLDPKNAKNVAKIRELTTPPQKPVTFGVGARACTIGGEEVMYRHELTFFNQTAIAIEVHDKLDEVTLLAAVENVTNFKFVRIGEELTLQAIAVRSVSKDPAVFKACVEKVASNTDLPLILCSLDAKVLEAGAKAIASKKPLLYAATKDNWKEVGTLAQELGLPVVAFSSNLDDLVSITSLLAKGGLKEICMDPGSLFGDGLVADSMNKIIMLRTAALEKGDPLAGYPIIGVPATVWMGVDKSSLSEDELHKIQYDEARFAGLMLSTDTSLVICHTGRNPEEVWFLMGFQTLRQNLFVDPRIYPSVDPGLFAVGNPTGKSPLFVTTNYRMTKIPVEEDLKAAKVDSWLLSVDTGGIGVESASAGGQFNADAVAEALEQFKWQEKVSHRVVIIPGMAARISGALEDAANAKVLVGPNDSSSIPKFVEKMWDVDKLMKEYEEERE